MSETVLARIAALQEKTTPELRVTWRELFDKEPPPFNRRYLEDRIAYQLQVLTHGGMKPATRAKLDRMVNELEPKAARRRVGGCRSPAPSCGANGRASSTSSPSARTISNIRAGHTGRCRAWPGRSPARGGTGGPSSR